MPGVRRRPRSRPRVVVPLRGDSGRRRGLAQVAACPRPIAASRHHRPRATPIAIARVGRRRAPSKLEHPCPHHPLPPPCATSRSSPTSTTARPPSSTPCCAPRASSTPTRARPRRPGHGLQRPGARAGHHHPRQGRLGHVADATAARSRSTSSTPPATPTSAARSSGRLAMVDGVAPARRRRRGARCPRPATCCPRRWPPTCPPSSCSTRSTARTPAPTRSSTRSTSSSSTSTSTTTTSSSRSSPPSPARAGPMAGVGMPGDGRRPHRRCSTPSSTPSRRSVGDPDAPLQALVTNLDASDYLGRLAIGRVVQGTLRKGDQVVICKDDFET